MKIGILNLSSRYDEFDRHGNAGQLIKRWISASFSEAELIVIEVAAGQAIPSADEFDGYILSGSEKGVYDETDWMDPLKALLIALRRKNIPVFGICFGHQIMAEAYGGKAIKSDEGFVVGIQQYDDDANSYSAYAMHQDQVVVVPDSAKVTASASYCPVAALDYDFPARSVQFHPEFLEPLVTDAIELFDGNLITSEEADNARSSMSSGGVVAETLLAEEITNFFRASLNA